MVTRWHFNIDGLDVEPAVWDLLLADAKTNPPSYVTIMDDKKRAQQWQSTIPQSQIIYRTYDAADNYFHHTVTPLQAAQRLEKDHHDIRSMWHYYRLNEAGGEWNRYQDWIIRFAQEAKARGFKVTAGGLALGKNWRTPEDIANGQADPLLDYAIANEDTFLLDAHEYVTGTLWSPQIPNYPSALFDRELILANENIPVLVDTYEGYQNFTNWGLFRVCWLANARSLERHGKRLNCVINEGLFDFNSHIIQDPHTWSKLPNGQTVKTETEIRKYGEPQFNTDVRGVLGSRKYFTWLVTGAMNGSLTDSQYCDFIMRNFAWAEKSYPENIKGIMLFAINSDWRSPQGHDYQPVIRTLLPKMAALTSIPVPTPNPEPEEPPQPEYRLLNIEGYDSVRNVPTRANIRLTPNGSIIGILASMPTVTRAKVSLAPATRVGDYEWVQVILYPDTEQAISGWIANHVFRIAVSEPVPDYAIAFAAIQLRIDAIQAALNEVETILDDIA
jgi:hypothetical protein